jgi:alkanesulfonate monooxygenase SsuD/methylene tetrahydromethanopterin reductase-like flavin-dependent oxidoreductase (luciferase family)
VAREADSIDARIPREQGRILGSPNRFKLAVFCANHARGTSYSYADGLPKATWAESTRLARAAEAAGIEGLIPLARWKEFNRGRPQDDRIFDPFTWAAGVAAVTERIQVFSTFHVPFYHPVIAAKMVATVDHISGGRFALNVVAGWSEAEHAMFDSRQLDHDDRYRYAEEWLSLLKRIWTEEDEFDHDGEFLKSTGIVSRPKPLQHPFPPIMSAGSSPAGRRFASLHADLNFVALPSFEQAPAIVAAAQADARAWSGRDAQIYGHGYIVCADSEAEARRRFDQVTREEQDTLGASAAVDALLGGAARSIDTIERDSLVDRVAAGFFALPLVGTAEQIAQDVQRLADAGLGGMAVSFDDYDEGIRRYDASIRPLLVEAGLRVE